MAKYKKEALDSQKKSRQIGNLYESNLKERLRLIRQFEKNYKKAVKAGSLIKDQMRYEDINESGNYQALKISTSVAESEASSMLIAEARSRNTVTIPEHGCSIYDPSAEEDVNFKLSLFQNIICRTFGNSHTLLISDSSNTIYDSPMFLELCNWCGEIMAAMDEEYRPTGSTILPKNTPGIMPRYPFDGPSRGLWDWFEQWPSNIEFIPDNFFFDDGTPSVAGQKVADGTWSSLHIGRQLYLLTYNTSDYFASHGNGTTVFGAKQFPPSPGVSPFYPIESIMFGLAYKTLRRFSGKIYSRWNHLRDTGAFTFEQDSVTQPFPEELPYSIDDGVRIFQEKATLTNLDGVGPVGTDSENIIWLDITQRWIDKFLDNGDHGGYVAYRSGSGSWWAANGSSGFMQAGRGSNLVKDNSWWKNRFESLFYRIVDWWRRIASGQGSSLTAEEHEIIKDLLIECSKILAKLSEIIAHEKLHIDWGQWTDRRGATSGYKKWGRVTDLDGPPFDKIETFRPYTFADWYRGSSGPEAADFWYAQNHPPPGKNGATPPTRHNATYMWGSFIYSLLLSPIGSPIDIFEKRHDYFCGKGNPYNNNWCDD